MDQKLKSELRELAVPFLTAPNGDRAVDTYDGLRRLMAANHIWVFSYAHLVFVRDGETISVHYLPPENVL